VKAEELALVRGWADTKASLRAWQDRPMTIVRPWAVGSLLVAVGLLGATWLIATLSDPDVSWLQFPGATHTADVGDYGFVLFRNSLVLTLHALACVAGFMAGSSLPMVAEGKRGLWRKVHEVAGPLAIAFVICATTFSLATQAFVLGGDAATLADQFGMSNVQFLAIISLHALPELFALFLPLAAWTIASRRGRWDELLAATFVTVAFAIPILLLAGAVEVWVTPRVLLSFAG
jgi:multisubunit Na+/H+ antiporter MnhC subunit